MQEIATGLQAFFCCLFPDYYGAEKPAFWVDLNGKAKSERTQVMLIKGIDQLMF
ncbi:hypothetical protein D3C87_1546350 [compost metagenome]